MSWFVLIHRRYRYGFFRDARERKEKIFKLADAMETSKERSGSLRKKNPKGSWNFCSRNHKGRDGSTQISTMPSFPKKTTVAREIVGNRS